MAIKVGLEVCRVSIQQDPASNTTPVLSCIQGASYQEIYISFYSLLENTMIQDHAAERKKFQHERPLFSDYQ